LSSAE